MLLARLLPLCFLAARGAEETPLAGGAPATIAGGSLANNAGGAPVDSRRWPPYEAVVPPAARRGCRAMQWMPRAAAAPAPQSQKKRERREYETMWPAWQTLAQRREQRGKRA